MAKQQTQTKPSAAAATLADKVAAALPATITQTNMVALANTTHGHGQSISGYHAGNTPCLAKTKVPMVAVNLLQAFVAKHPGAYVVPAAPNTTWGLQGPVGGPRHTIQAAVMAGGPVAEIVAVSKANGATARGYADLVALVWLGCVEVVARPPAK